MNSGILGHRAVAALLADVVSRMPCLDATHINLSEDLTLADRVIRRALCLRAAPQAGPAANLDVSRWRQELHAGLLAARRIAAAERRSGPFDLFHFHTQATAYASLARMRRTPSIVSIDTTQHHASLQATSRLARATYWPSVAHDGAVFRAAGAIVATSEWAAGDLRAVYPGCADKVHVMPYPVTTLEASDAWIRERAARAAETPAPPVRVLFMGGDFPRKGGADLLAAWAAGGFGDRATLDLVTDWPVGDTLPPGVRHTSGVAPRTRAWIELWRRADLFVMPTRHEAFGMVYQEAAAAGVPSIATRIGAVPEIVQDGDTGLLVPVHDQHALVGALGTLIGSATLRHRMGQAARERMQTAGSPERYASRLGAIIERLVETHGFELSHHG